MLLATGRPAMARTLLAGLPAGVRAAVAEAHADGTGHGLEAAREAAREAGRARTSCVGTASPARRSGSWCAVSAGSS